MADLAARAGEIKDRVFVGEQFIVIEASPQHSVELDVAAGGADFGPKPTRFTQTTVLSRHMYSVKSSLPQRAFWGDAPLRRLAGGDEPLLWPRLSVASLELGALVSDRLIYKPKDTVRLFVVAPATAGATVSLTVRQAGQLMLQRDVELNSAGLALTTLEDLDEGEYDATVAMEGRWSAECRFSVAAFSLSLLTAILEKHSYVEKTLHFDVSVSQLGTPYNGAVDLGLQCSVCSERVVATTVAKAQGGKLSSAFDIGGHGGPFHVQITTAGGDTATVSFPNTRSDVREPAPINTLGEHVSCSLLPAADAKQVRGLYLQRGESSTTPFMVDEVVTQRGVLRCLVDAGPLQIVTIDPLTAAVSLTDVAEVKKGQTLSVAVRAPYTLYCIGGIAGGKPFEGWGAFIGPEDIAPALDAPKHAASGAQITVRVETGKPAHCLLLVYDVRLEHESPAPKLAKQLFSSLRANSSSLRTGYVSPLGQTLRPPQSQMLGEGAGPDMAFLRSAGRPQPMMAAMPVMAAAVAMPAAADAAAVAQDVAGRSDFPQLVFADLFAVDAAAERTVTLGEQIGVWRCRAYVVRGLDFIELSADVETSKEVYVELDMPAFVAPGDRVLARARYHTPQAADLQVQTATGLLQQRVQGDGTVDIKLSGPGEVVARLVGSSASDVMSRVAAMPGRQKVTTSRLLLLRAGQTVEGERVVVYPNMGALLSESIESLIQYPYGCAEQTSSKLYGLAIAYRGISQGLLHGDKVRVSGLLTTGLRRLQTFAHADGNFSLWQGGQPDSRVTAKVAHYLLAARGLSFDLAEELLGKAGEALLKAKVKDNQLLPLNVRFRDRLQSAQDAAALYFHGGDAAGKEASLNFLRSSAIRGDGTAHWPAGTAWGGSLETTCDATRVLFAAGDPLYRDGFAYAGAQLIDGRLYSTSDTRAMVEMLALLTANGHKVRLDGVEVTATQPLIGHSVTALDDDVAVRVDTVREIDYLEPGAGFLFDVTVAKRKLAPGQRTQVTVRLRESSLCPLARIYLPANLALLKGGANAQEAHIPLTGQELTLDVVAVRHGRARLFVTVHDMYDRAKVGTAQGIEVVVE